MTHLDPTKSEHAIRYWLLGKGFNRALTAMEFAKKHHSGTRKDGVTPEFHHQVSIALYIKTLPSIVELENVFCAAFLHDVVEDYNISLVEIEQLFGINVRDIVQLLSKKVNGFKVSEVDYFHRLSNLPTASIVKGCDRINNFATMQGVFSAEKQKAYIAECREHIMPMLKEARRRFPEQEPAYENIKYMLNMQMQLIEFALPKELAK